LPSARALVTSQLFISVVYSCNFIVSDGRRHLRFIDAYKPISDDDLKFLPPCSRQFQIDEATAAREREKRREQRKEAQRQQRKRKRLMNEQAERLDT
jgi:hypothetical protein